MELGSILLYIVCYFGLFSAIFFFITFFENKGALKNPKAKRYPKVTITVPAYNEGKTIAKTIKSLLNLDYPKNKLEIFVIDDGSKDNTYKVAKRFEKQCVKVFTKKNTGKGDTLNFALKIATGEFFGALDADSFVNRDCLKRMVGYFDNPKIMAVTPALKIWKPKGFLQRIQSMEYLVGLYLRKMFACLGSIHVTPGPFTIYRKSFFDKYGNYDKDNITEDIEVALRIQSKRFVIENLMDATVYTVGPNTFKDLLIQRRRWFLGFLNNVINYKHLFHPSYGNLGLFILPASFFSVILVILVCFYTLYKFSDRFYTGLLNLLAVNFDIRPFLKLNFDTFFLNLGPLVILSLFSLAAGITIIYIAKKYSKEKGNIKLSYVFYLIVYWFFFAFWWTVAGIYKITNKKIEWGKKTA